MGCKYVEGNYCKHRKNISPRENSQDKDTEITKSEDDSYYTNQKNNKS